MRRASIIRFVVFVALILAAARSAPIGQTGLLLTPNAAINTAQAASTGNQYYVNPATGSDVWDGKSLMFNGVSGPWRSLDKANLALRPGDTVFLASGTYGVTPQPAASGTAAGGYVTYAAAPNEHPVVVRPANLNDRSYIRLQGIDFQSPTGIAWIVSNTGTHHIELIENNFNSAATAADAFGGINIAGSAWTLRRNTFGQWRGNTIHANDVTGLLIEDNDFSQALGEHALVGVVGNNVIVRNNYFRNPWARVLHITWNGAKSATNILVENNLFIDSDWNGQTPAPGIANPGSSETIRLLATRAIFRNNLLLGNRQGWNWNTYATMSFQTFSNPVMTSEHYEKIRVYHNTFAQNRRSSVIFVKNSKKFYISDNKFKNNIFSEPENFAIAMPDSSIPWKTYLFEANLFFSSRTDQTIYLNAQANLGQVQTAAPTVFKANLAALPRFVNPQILAAACATPAAYCKSNIGGFFNAFGLTAGTPGTKVATPLATVSSTVANTRSLGVDDALYFSDGMGMIAGDRIVIGRNPAVTVTKIASATTIEVDNPVTASAGDKIFLERGSTTPDIGVFHP
ncbi:MAG: right-handed parallel beta-helix repeat-containing protein [Planctomycetota bacterium]|nr:right-handed parallel beta-helix repeat-containing protein [Planctomycetota bacterium]